MGFFFMAAIEPRMRVYILALALLTAVVALWYFGKAPIEATAVAANNPPDPAAVERFIAEFDRNISNAPIAADLVGRDTEFRARVLQTTATAFGNGGWKAADDALSAVMGEKEQVVTWTELHADDALVVALWRRYLAVHRKLQDRPTACRYSLSGNNAGSAAFAVAEHEAIAASKAAQAAYAAGARNLASGAAPELPDADTYEALLVKLTELGKPFSAAEWAAIRGGPRAAVPDSVFCDAQIKFDENLLLLPENEAAALIRGNWGGWIAAQRAAPHG
jgi:hypothetical protein